MSPTDRGGDDDDHAFAEAMRGARPLAPGRERVAAAPAAAPQRKREPRATPAFVVKQTGDAISGRAPDVAVKLLAELRGGAHAIEARLDLHGRGRDAALADLERFVATARAHGARCLLMIHGRGRRSDVGGPVLRPAVWEWLASPAAARCSVLAFTSARPHD